MYCAERLRMDIGDMVRDVRGMVKGRERYG